MVNIAPKRQHGNIVVVSMLVITNNVFQCVFLKCSNSLFSLLLFSKQSSLHVMGHVMTACC